MNKELVPFDYDKAVNITKRYEKLYSGSNPGALIQVRSCGDNGIDFKKVRPLNGYKFPEDRWCRSK